MSAVLSADCMLAIQYCLSKDGSSPSCWESCCRRCLCCGSKSFGSVSRSPSTSWMMFVCSGLVSPSTSLMCILAFLYNHWRCVIFKTLLINWHDHYLIVQLDDLSISVCAWSWNRLLHIRPSMKLSHPSASWSRAKLYSSGCMLVMDFMDCLPRYCKYDVRASMRSVCPWAAPIQSNSSWEDWLNISTLPLLRHLVIWEVSSLICLQHMQIFVTVWSILESCLFVPQKCETCLVTHRL